MSIGIVSDAANVSANANETVLETATVPEAVMKTVTKMAT